MNKRFDKETGTFVLISHWYARRPELMHNAGKAPMVFGDLKSFVSPVHDQIVDGRREYRNHMTRHDLEPAGDLTLDESLTARPNTRQDMRPLRDVVDESVAMVEKGYKPESHEFWPDELKPPEETLNAQR